MIVVDTSVFVAILRAEPEEAALTEALLSATELRMSAGNYLECAMVALGRGLAGRGDLDEWLSLRRVEVIPADRNQAELAADAFARYGKGRHPAALNFGDCFAYALAKGLGARLLFTGEDFARTDIEPALV